MAYGVRVTLMGQESVLYIQLLRYPIMNVLKETLHTTWW